MHEFTSRDKALGWKPRAAESPEAIWGVGDLPWCRIEPILTVDAPPPPRRYGGRPRIDWRTAISGIIFRMRSGRQCPSVRAVRRQQLGPALGPERGLRGGLRRPGRGMRGTRAIQREWQVADAMLGKARFGGEKTGKNPTDRGKTGAKKSLLTDGEGGPLGVAIAGANVLRRNPSRGCQMHRHACRQSGSPGNAGDSSISLKSIRRNSLEDYRVFGT